MNDETRNILEARAAERDRILQLVEAAKDRGAGLKSSVSRLLGEELSALGQAIRSGDEIVPTPRELAEENARLRREIVTLTNQCSTWGTFFRDTAEACLGARTNENDPGNLDAICRREVQSVREMIGEYGERELGWSDGEWTGRLSEVVEIALVDIRGELTTHQEIVEGSMVPPSEAELDALEAEGGGWLVSHFCGVRLYFESNARETAAFARTRGYRWRWIAIGSDGSPRKKPRGKSND